MIIIQLNERQINNNKNIGFIFDLDFKLMKKFTSILFLLLPILNFAANSNGESFKKNSIGIAYFGDLSFNNKKFAINPGIELNYAWQLYGKRTRKGNEYSTKFKDRQFFLKPFVFVDVRKHYNTSIALGADITYRSTFPNALYWDLGLGTGYMHSFYNDPVYEQVNDSTFKKVRVEGNPNVIVRGNLHIGYDCSKNESGLPLAFYFGGGIFIRYPQSNAWIVRQSLEAGVNIFLTPKKKVKNETL
jgi:hypothetical protein